ncbi:tautomerase family protein [Paraburkholderia sp.]|uniref:tautomerase family protein n=1 Tax=Paraburkholderia sp. TaxID=1926495 RepID=UPI00286EC11E|nr:tautomerase family protein [Paraburkholderia sp.]
MPHVIVKAWPGKTEAQKHALAVAITREIVSILGNGPDSVSIAFEEVEPSRWKEAVYVPDIKDRPDILLKKPGYQM